MYIPKKPNKQIELKKKIPCMFIYPVVLLYNKHILCIFLKLCPFLVNGCTQGLDIKSILCHSIVKYEIIIINTGSLTFDSFMNENEA